MRKHLVIPDTQITPTSPKDHLSWIGQYILEKKPDVIVNLGDFADMESLSSYDKGKLKAEGKRYKKDIEAAKEGMELLLGPMRRYNARRKTCKKKGYNPEMHLTIGNHEQRITRAVESDAAMEGFMSIDDLEYEKFGWQVHPFLEIVELDGISYSHYFYNPLSGRPYGGYSIDTMLKNLGFSFVQGHRQQYLVGNRSLNNGRIIRGLINGSAYLHNEDYRGPQANGEMRAVFLLHEVDEGNYMLTEISLDFLCWKYEGVHLWQFMKNKYPEIYKQSPWMVRQETRS